MNLLNPGVEKIILYSESETYTLSGNDISPQSTLTRRVQTRSGARGGYLPFLVEHTLEIKFSNSELYSDLGQVFTDERFYNILVEKFNGFYVWGANERILREEDVLFDPESEDYPYIFKLRNISESPPVGQDGNLLGEFVDMLGFGTPYGWTTQSSTSETFQNGVFESDGQIYKLLQFAYPGEEYTFSIDWISLHSNADNIMDIQFLDSNVDLISDESLTITGTGNFSVTATAPSGSEFVVARCLAENITSPGSYSVENPKLTIG